MRVGYTTTEYKKKLMQKWLPLASVKDPEKIQKAH